jgi:hypothetical protein
MEIGVKEAKALAWGLEDWRRDLADTTKFSLEVI